MTEEILIRMGLDSKSVLKGMESLKSKVVTVAKSIGGQLAAAFAFQAVVSHIKTVIDHVEQLDQRAGALGISASFLQDIENVGMAAGKSAEQMQRMMTAFTQGLSPGQDVEGEFRKFLDTISAIKDPVLRAQAAFDKLGKSGVVLLDVARDGSAAFREAAAQFSKLSDAEVRGVLLVDKQLDEVSNKLKTFTAKLLFALVKATELNRKDLDGLDTKDKIKIIAQEDVIASRVLTLKKSQEAHENKIAAARLVAAEASKVEAKASEQIVESFFKLEEKLNAAKAARSAGLRNLSNVPMSEAEQQATDKFGSLPGLNFSDKQLGDVRVAQELDIASKQMRIEGRPDVADEMQRHRIGILSGMGFASDDARNPLASLEAQVKAATTATQDLLQLARERGFNVAIVDVK